MNVFIVVIILVCLSVCLSVCPSVCPSVRPSVCALTLTSFNRFSSNLAHRLLRSRGQSLVIFSFRGQTPWGQEGVKGAMLAYGQKFLLHISIEESMYINFCQGTTGLNFSISSEKLVKLYDSPHIAPIRCKEKRDTYTYIHLRTQFHDLSWLVII